MFNVARGSSLLLRAACHAEGRSFGRTPTRRGCEQRVAVLPGSHPSARQTWLNRPNEKLCLDRLLSPSAQYRGDFISSVIAFDGYGVSLVPASIQFGEERARM
jgi:hypothetical protein